MGLNRDLAPISDKAWERLEGEARDVLEAQDALLDARLLLSAALVDYAISRLDLMRDLEALAIEPKGLRYDRSLPIPTAGLSLASEREDNIGG